MHRLQPQSVKVQDLPHIFAKQFHLPGPRAHSDQQRPRHKLTYLCSRGIAEPTLAGVTNPVPREVVLHRGDPAPGAQSQQSPQLRLNAKSPLRTHYQSLPSTTAQK